jgi:molybdate transport system substrate-binding protein
MLSRPLRAVLVLSLSLSTGLASTACRAPARQTVIVFAAASLGESFRAIETAFEAAHPELDVVINLAGSQLLATQLLEGAPADVFASADAATLDRVLADRPELSGTRQAFASNQLVIVVPSESEADSFAEIEQLVRQPGVKVVLAGPEVPVGRYARKTLDQLGLREAFEARLVSNEDSVDGVLSKLELGECDIGIAYSTDSGRSDKLRAIAFPEHVDVTARYELAVLADGPAPELGRSFAEFVAGPQGQAVLHEHGFGP